MKGKHLLPKPSPPTINAYTAWHPRLRPLARLLVGTLLCNALAPLSVLAQDKGTVPISPLVQSQLRRAAVLQQDLQRAQAAQALSSKEQRPTPQKAGCKTSTKPPFKASSTPTRHGCKATSTAPPALALSMKAI